MDNIQHLLHLENNEWHEDCEECQIDHVAIDWLLAVRKFGIETANKMFEKD
jgi:hypothetical protein